MFAFLRRVWTAFNEDHAMRLAASIAYGALFALTPLLIVLIAVAGALLGPANNGHAHHVAEDAILSQIRSVAGDGAASSVQQLVAAAFAKPREGIVAQTIGWITFACGASALFAACQDALNAIWHIEAVRGGWKHVVRDRAASFVLVAGIGALLVVSLILNGAMVALGAHLPELGRAWWVSLAGKLVSFALLAVAFALMYKVLPDVDVRWRDVWWGAAITAALFVVGQVVIGYYFAFAAVASVYGAAGSLLVLLTWLYYSAVIVLLGAECAKVQTGDAHSSAPVAVRLVVERPAGVDPRRAEQ